MNSLSTFQSLTAASTPAATQTPTMTPEDVQQAVESSAAFGWAFLTGTGLRIAIILILATVLTFIARRIIHRFSRSIAEGHTRRGLFSSLPQRSSAGSAFDSAARARRSQRSQTVGSLLQSVAAIVIWVITTMMVLNELGFDLAPVLASAGIVGLALGFGAQTLVKDYLSGFFIVIEDQFGIGDIIDVGEAVGTVEEVGLRITKIRSLEGTLWHVRNGEILRVGNFSQGWANAVLDLNFPYDVDEETAHAIVRDTTDVMRKDPAYDSVMLEDPTIMGVQSVSGESVMIRALIKTKPSEQWGIERAFRGEFKRQMAHRGLTVPWSASVLRTMPDQAVAEGTSASTAPGSATKTAAQSTDDSTHESEQR